MYVISIKDWMDLVGDYYVNTSGKRLWGNYMFKEVYMFILLYIDLIRNG